MKQLMLMVIPFQDSLLKYLFQQLLQELELHASSVLCFHGLNYLLAKTLTSVEAKPIAATMTRTASTAGYELGFTCGRRFTYNIYLEHLLFILFEIILQKVLR